MARELTEKQKLFVEYLFYPEVGGNAAKAKVMAGYSPNVSTSSIIASLKEEIMNATRDYLVQHGPKAVIKIVGVMDKPSDLGNKELLAASKDVLDRIGIVKTEKVEITAPALFILPPKQEDV